MKKFVYLKPRLFPLLVGTIVGLLAMAITVSFGMAAPPLQDGEPTPSGDPQDCKTCHLDIAETWSHSTHAHAYDDPFFQERWESLGQPGDCLVCHTTNYQATDGSYSAEGVDCEACHGKANPNHPTEPMPIRADTEYCGTCHTTTIGEWRLTGHSTSDVGCTDCHNPHDQGPLFENADEMCLNCHGDSMGDYLEDLHVKNNIGCVDCHALVIPPEVIPDDGIVPTGHTFTITPATCVACHTDALHAGFHLPGYEDGAKAANGGEKTGEEGEGTNELVSRLNLETPEEVIQQLETELQAVYASTASRNMTTLFQGGVIGLVLGGSTAWFVAHNVRRGRELEEDQSADEGDEGAETEDGEEQK